MSKRIEKTDEEWRRQLTPEQYDVLRQKGTERAFTGEYDSHKGKGTFACAGCAAELFSSETKFNSGTGWPSFWQPLTEESVTEVRDESHGMTRTEVLCSACDGHLGHLFPDGPRPTGDRYCINSVSLKLSDEE